MRKYREDTEIDQGKITFVPSKNDRNLNLYNFSLIAELEHVCSAALLVT